MAWQLTGIFRNTKSVEQSLQAIVDIAALSNESTRFLWSEKCHVKFYDEPKLFRSKRCESKRFNVSNVADASLCRSILEVLTVIAKRSLFPQLSKLRMENTPDALLFNRPGVCFQGSLIPKHEFHRLNS